MGNVKIMTGGPFPSQFNLGKIGFQAEVAELADALASGASSR